MWSWSVVMCFVWEWTGHGFNSWYACYCMIFGSISILAWSVNRGWLMVITSMCHECMKAWSDRCKEREQRVYGSLLGFAKVVFVSLWVLAGFCCCNITYLLCLCCVLNSWIVRAIGGYTTQDKGCRGSENRSSRWVTSVDPQVQVQGTALQDRLGLF